MVEVVGVALLILSAFALMLFLGVIFWIRKHRAAALTVYAATAAVTWWAGHYFNQLPWDAQGDLLWHKRYMLAILVLGPLSVLLSGAIGYRLRMKEYFGSHGAEQDTGKPGTR
ncbi:MAG TPA: hypothetical protein PK280_12680 [Planctomycetota bacterium]|nr:hypothetical protein [Planctomycetota bacterium]